MSQDAASTTTDEKCEQSFERANAGNAATSPEQAIGLQQCGYAMLDGHPCRITTITKSKAGKHGHRKVIMTGTDLVTGKECDFGGSAGYNICFSFVEHKTCPLLKISSDGLLTIFDAETGKEKEDVQVPESDLGRRIREMWYRGGGECSVTVISAGDKEIAVDVVSTAGASDKK